MHSSWCRATYPGLTGIESPTWRPDTVSPAIYGDRAYVEAGGLMSYAPSLLGMFRRAGVLLGKILNGANSATLPVEQPTKFDLIVNLKTAKALNLTIPQSVLIRVDEMIE